MNAFVFRLEKVLDLRRIQLRIAEAAVEQTRNNIRLAEDTIVDLTHSRGAAIETLSRSRQFRGMEFSTIVQQSGWTIREVGRLRGLIQQYSRSLDEQTTLVTRNRRAVKLIERLRERKLETWTAEFEKELVSLGEDVALARWRRNRQAASV